MPNQDTSNSSLHDKLRSVFDRAKLPTNPVIAAKVLDLVNDPNSSSSQFADVIKNDPALTARLMKLGNSALFLTRHPVTTIQRAVTVLGLRRIRMAAVSFQLVAHLDRLGQAPFDLQSFWQQSVLKACLAREVALKVIPELSEEAFLVGLLQDCGILLLVQLLGEKYARLYRDGKLSPAAFYAAEQKHFKYNHLEVIEALSEEWKLPDQIAMPLAHHHKIARLAGKSNEITRLCAVSYFVGSIRMEAGQETTKAELRLLEYAKTDLHLSAEALETIFENVGQAYEAVSELFSGVLPDNLNVTDLLIEVNHQLNIVVRANDEHVQEVEAERDKFNEERKTLRNAVAQYREIAARDPLTGVLNRGALLENAMRLLLDVSENDQSITAFFIDIDNFKSFNDEHGHEMGDVVLKHVARVLKDSLCNEGFVGRYGGEEFVVVTSGLSDESALEYARRLVDDVSNMDVSKLKLEDPVTCSLGAVSGKACCTPEELFAMADKQMYLAKRAGKNQASFKSMDGSHESKPVASPSATIPTPDALDRFVEGISINANRLLSTAIRLNANDTNEFLNVRKQPRQQMITPCQVSYLAGSSLSIKSEDACIRNVSAGGISLVVGRPLMRGDLIELRIYQKEENLYAAGLVAFCRHIEGALHEIGVQLISNDRKPIFSENPLQAISRFNWVARAVHEKYGDELGRSRRQSA